MTLDEWLSQLYSADLRGKLAGALVDFKTVLAGDPTLTTAAQDKYLDLQKMIAARGEQACAFSTKYRNYLREALEP